MGLALFAARVEPRQPTPEHSYGYVRSGIVAAFVNALVLSAIALSLIATGLMRLFHPVTVDATPVIWLAAISLAFNFAGGLVLHDHDGHDLNVRAMFWHVVGDALGSLAILVAAILLKVTHWAGWDPVAAILIGLVIAQAAYQVVRPSVRILMEGTPEGIDPETVRRMMMADPAVDEVHHLHVWSLGPHYHALSAHVRLRNMSIREGQGVIDNLEDMLGREYEIRHVTIQLEADQHLDDEVHGHK